MRRIHIGLLSEDAEYARRLMAYIRESAYRSSVSAVLFTEQESCALQLSQAGAPELLLVDEAILGRGEIPWLHFASCKLLLLHDGNQECLQGLDTTPKYQPLNLLMNLVTELLRKDTASASVGHDQLRRSFVLGVYSPVGGAGKTVFAYIAAGLLARIGYRPLVLSLESAPSLCWSTGADEDAFGRTMFEVAKAPRNACASIDRYCTEGNSKRIWMLPGARNIAELEEMSEEDSARLIEAAAASERWDVVIADLDSSLSPRTIGALKRCGKAACLVPDHLIGMDKTRRVLQLLDQRAPELSQGFSIIINGCRGAPSDTAALGRDAEEALPYQPEWQNLSSMEQLNEKSLYQERLYNWLVHTMDSSGLLPGGVSSL
ncbi:MAG: hypothetical protein K0R57_2309 [Paenibacillaceae bacterium]|jgi:MinD-like ATPase involved in chromosome partitioning or flagellar assembly|nr:hypothetical protein [Paenibacillaceae bacterium]